MARDLYRQCVDEDPAFAPAWARLGRCHRLLAKYYLDRPEENLARADEAFRRALELDPELPVAHKLYAHREAETGRARDAMVRLLGLARRTATTPRSSPASSTPAATAACSRPPRRPTARRGGSTRTSRRASSTPGGPGATWSGSSRRRRTRATSSCGRWRSRRWGGSDEARQSLRRGRRPRPWPRCSRAILRALLALIDRSPEAAEAFAELAATHTDPEALFMYGACQARVGDTARALATLIAAVDGGFAVPQALAAPVARAAPRRRRLDAPRRRAPRPPGARRSGPSATPAARPCSAPARGGRGREAPRVRKAPRAAPSPPLPRASRLPRRRLAAGRAATSRSTSRRQSVSSATRAPIAATAGAARPRRRRPSAGTPPPPGPSAAPPPGARCPRGSGA